MAIKKITEETTSTIKSGAYVLVTQQETVNGEETEALRRIPADTFATNVGWNIGEGANAVKMANATSAEGINAVAEGQGTEASGTDAHAEGYYTTANHLAQHVFGQYNEEDPSSAESTDRGNYVEIVGNGTADNARTNARTLDWNGNEVLAGKLTVGANPTNDMDVVTKRYFEDNGWDLSDRIAKGVSGNNYVTGAVKEGHIWQNNASGEYSHAEGTHTSASAANAHSEGSATTASGQCSHSEGTGTTASGAQSHAEGSGSSAVGSSSHAEGEGTRASNNSAHAEGYGTRATGLYSHSEGNVTMASGMGAHAEGGSGTRAASDFAHAEGYGTSASGLYSHSEGEETQATAEGAHSEGKNTVASGNYSHSEGNYTIANHKSQHVFGEYNVEDDNSGTNGARGDYVEIVGNGTADEARSNARTLDWSGNESLAGSLTLGKGTADETTITAAGAKAVGDELSSLSDDLSNYVPKPTSSPDGTSGQLLRTNGDGTTTWVDEGLPTDAQTDAAVSAWLDEHPEATTTIEDGAVTWAKLNSAVQEEIDGKAPAIIATSDPSNSFTAEQLSGYGDYELICDTDGYTSVAVAKGCELYPSTDSATATTYYTKSSGNTVVINGSPTGEKYFFSRVSGASNYAPNVAVAAGVTVNLAVYVDGTISGSSTANNAVEFYFKYSDGTNKLKRIVLYSGASGLITDSYTAIDDVVSVSVYVVIKGGYTFDNVSVSWSGNIDDSYSTIQTSGQSSITISDDYIGDNDFIIFPPTAYAQYMADTKTYIDTHLPADMLTEDDLVYLSPEMYGAVGDGITDDYQAVQDCIDAAIAGGKTVRGYGWYKISTGVVIDGGNLDVELDRITYTGTGNAITIAGVGNKFVFNIINAQSTGANAIKITSSSGSNPDTNRIVVDGIMIYADVHGVDLEAAENQYVLYIVLRIKGIYSATSDAIVSGERVGEVAVYDTRFACQNGWAFNGRVAKLFNCTMEHNCYGGVYALGITMSHCRTREMMDCLMPGNPYYGESTGIVFKAKTGAYLELCKIDADDILYYDSIDLSEMVPLSDGTAAASYKNFVTGIVNCPIIFGDQNYRYGTYIIGSKMILHGKDKICVPQFPSQITVSDTTYDMRDGQEYSPYRKPFVTKFIIGVDGSTIYLSPSYCAEGYNSFTVDMTNYLCTIYDRRGDLLFDPTGYSTGVYQFDAIVDPTVDTTYQKNEVSDQSFYYPINSGYCDVWTITKIS